MRPSILSRVEFGFLLVCAAAWLAVIWWLPPDTGGTDVYMFRDPACNFQAGLGFRSASVDHAHSFQPMLYSHYTPLYLWLFIPVAKPLGCTSLANTVFQGFWTLLIDIAVVVVGLRFLEKPVSRWLFLILVAMLLPLSVVRPDDRPEPLSFCILIGLVILLRREPTRGLSLLAGLLSAAAFLSEPFAGVIAVFLITGWLIAALMRRTTGLKASLGVAAVSALAYLLPIAVVAVSFYAIDHQSLRRFMYQAVNTGVSRDATYTTGEAVNWNQSKVDQSSRLEMIEAGLKTRKIMGPLTEFETAFEGIMILTWIGLLVAAQGGWHERLALAAAGVICFVVPIVVFPMQGHYLILGCALFPILLGLNWAQSRGSLRHTAVIPVLIAILIIAELPSEALSLLRNVEVRSSYRYAEAQAQLFRQYLLAHPPKAPVVLVPATHYFLYKDVAHNIYNPQYLSYQYQNPAEIGAVVNCYEATKNFDPGTLPLPAFVAREKWQAISMSHDPVAVTLLHHKVMSKNWTMECDLYVRALDR